jgi:hypothetical protein
MKLAYDRVADIYRTSACVDDRWAELRESVRFLPSWVSGPRTGSERHVIASALGKCFSKTFISTSSDCLSATVPLCHLHLLVGRSQ